MSNSQTISANGASNSVTLKPGPNLISIFATTIAASTVARLQVSTDGFASHVCELADPDDSTVKAQLDNGDADSTTSCYARSFVLYGPGQARVYVTDYSGSTAITIAANQTSAR